MEKKKNCCDCSYEQA